MYILFLFLDVDLGFGLKSAIDNLRMQTKLLESCEFRLSLIRRCIKSEGGEAAIIIPDLIVTQDEHSATLSRQKHRALGLV